MASNMVHSQKKLHEIHAEERERRGPTDELPSNQPVARARGFVTVNQVTPGSPASVAVSQCKLYNYSMEN